VKHLPKLATEARQALTYYLTGLIDIMGVQPLMTVILASSRPKKTTNVTYSKVFRRGAAAQKRLRSRVLRQERSPSLVV
jgi:hypothetical protein